MTSIALYPTQEQIQTLLSGPGDIPVVMLNLLRFREHAEPPHEGMSGEEAYQLYADRMLEFVESKGARVIWTGTIDSQLIGEGADQFHMVALIEWPSRRAFVEATSDPFVQEIGVHRAAGLEGQWLLAMTTRRAPAS